MASRLRAKSSLFTTAMWLTASILCIALPAYASEKNTKNELDYLNLTLEQLGKIKISIATGNETPIEQAPAVATVITAQQIEAMGARTVDDVLETVPGLHVSLSSTNRLDSIYSIRGIHTALNPHVLFLVNNVPLQNPVNGGRPILFRQSVNNISRIEIIRGPGSAIYGADAFSGVINIITKTAREIPDTEIGSRVGSFDFQEAWLKTGKEFDQWAVSFYLNYQHSDGDDERIIDSDFQTFLDTSYSTSASLAPGSLYTRYDILDTQLGFQHDKWTINLRSWTSKDTGTGAGGAQALDPSSNHEYSLYTGDATYTTTDFIESWENTVSLKYVRYKQEVSYVLLPPGSQIGIGADGNFNPFSPDIVLFTDGLIGNPGATSDDASIEFTNIYENLKNHNIRVSFGSRYQKLETTEEKNFGPGVLDNSPPPSPVDGMLSDVSNTENVYLKDTSRKVKFFSLQDEWSINPKWFLVAGVRYDDYSDFGDTTNPRVSLVWKTNNALTTKLLYGSAFRAPSFGELGFKNNPAIIGDSDLNPETIDTLELSFNYQPQRNIRSTLSLFAYQASDLIEYVVTPAAGGNVATNARDQEGHGFEWELGWEINNLWRITGSYALQRSEDSDTGETIADAPQQQLTINNYWKISPSWLLSAQLNTVADRERAPNDSRPDIDDYSLVDVFLKSNNLYKDLDIAFGVKNLFDEDAREPSDSSGFIPNDIPLEGRSVFLEMRYQF